jgi:hypothetical protein
MSDDQSRLQEYGVDITVEGPDPDPSCVRCGVEVDDPAPSYQNRLEAETGIRDVDGERSDPVCEECKDVQRFLKQKYRHLTEKIGVSGAVAVHCECQDPDEIDVQPIRRGESPGGRACSRCGSREVVIERLPPGENPALPWVKGEGRE